MLPCSSGDLASTQQPAGKRTGVTLYAFKALPCAFAGFKAGFQPLAALARPNKHGSDRRWSSPSADLQCAALQQRRPDEQQSLREDLERHHRHCVSASCLVRQDGAAEVEGRGSKGEVRVTAVSGEGESEGGSRLGVGAEDETCKTSTMHDMTCTRPS